MDHWRLYITAKSPTKVLSPADARCSLSAWLLHLDSAGISALSTPLPASATCMCCSHVAQSATASKTRCTQYLQSSLRLWLACSVVPVSSCPCRLANALIPLRVVAVRRYGGPANWYLSCATSVWRWSALWWHVSCGMRVGGLALLSFFAVLFLFTYLTYLSSLKPAFVMRPTLSVLLAPRWSCFWLRA